MHCPGAMRYWPALAIALVACAAASSPNDTDPTDPGPNGGGSPGATADGGRGTAPPNADGGARADADIAPSGDALKTVFLIMMENHSWSTIATSDDAPYINAQLVPQGGHAEGYVTPPGNHPSELNYIWLEAGDNLGIKTDDDPAQNHQATTDHLSGKLTAAGIPWKAYVEDITGNNCPLTGSGNYAPRHTPQLYFDDMTDKNSPTSKTCIDHIRPYTELASDLQKRTVARYNFITPNLCNDMHGYTLSCTTQNFHQISGGDTWLSQEIPKIMASDAYKDNGVIFVLWDEGDEPLLGGEASDGPIPLLVLSPKAKKGYKSTTKLTHSSMLKTLQEIFGITPLLRGAANATDLSEFFTSFP
jgi:hypothetical protein